MTDLEILTRILLALSFGAILGLETETRASNPDNDTPHKSEKEVRRLMQQRLGGLRTYTVLALFGAVSGLLYISELQIFSYLMFAGVLLIVLAAYVLNVNYQKAFGMTTEIAVLTTVLVGFATTTGLISLQILLVVIVVLTFILSQKRGVIKFTRLIAHEELIDIVKFGIVALVIFPFLPNTDIYLRDLTSLAVTLQGFGISEQLINNVVLINPFRLWQYVVLISGFNLLGYFASRLSSHRAGLMIAGVLGGLISSTSTTVAFAQRSRDSKKQDTSFAAISLIANSVSFLQVSALALSASVIFFQASVPLSVAMATGSLVVAIWYWRQHNEKRGREYDVEHRPFSIGPALNFAILLTLIRLGVQLISFYFGSNAFIMATALSGLVGIDIATISLGEMVATGNIGVSLALVTFLLTNGVNFAGKAIYGYIQGSRNFASIVLIGMLMSFIFGAVTLLLT